MDLLVAAANNAILPQIYEYEDFYTCRQKFKNFVYCVSDTTLQPNTSSNLWKRILQLQSNRRNFPHDQLERGLCLNEYYDDVTLNNDTYKLLDTYISNKIYNQYGLNSHSKINFCWTTTHFTQHRTFGECFFVFISLLLILTTSFATWKELNNSATDSIIIKSFSVRRNLQCLLVASKPNSLPYLEGLRALGTLIILIVHSQLPIIRMPVWNTEDLESQANHVMFPLINSANTHMIQFFFTLGGMVFGISCLSHFERFPEFKIMYFLIKILRRLIRLLPVYAFIIIYQATWYKRMKQGPLEYKFNDYCLEHWWTNLLFINNYIQPTKPCLQFSWYLGADFQLFLIGSVLLMAVWKYPLIKNPLISLMILAALSTPAYVIYNTSTDATMNFDMRHALAELRTYDHFLKYYLPSHTNISSYFFGIIAAMMYMKFNRSDSQHIIKQLLQKLLTFSLVILFSLNISTTFLPFVNIDNKKSIFNAIFGSLLKCSWGCSYSILFLVFELKSKSRLINVLSHNLMHFLAKISYCVYIVQYSVIYGLYTNFHVPMIYGGFNMLLLTSAIILLTLICAMFLYLAIEAPIVQIGNKYITLLSANNSSSKNVIEIKPIKQL
ncbi:O-acyltransferase like protein-like isoform X3 [Anopheles merus]|uniref:O-acyltransferase like protein-like isoform X3 n=1 Tax=Anopheles merus TaxID=30066 RepID=UPI001BE492D4|nr:O-acyltransferase like protein-like isoform X3 [Anopheles merus]